MIPAFIASIALVVVLTTVLLAVCRCVRTVAPIVAFSTAFSLMVLACGWAFTPDGSAWFDAYGVLRDVLATISMGAAAVTVTQYFFWARHQDAGFRSPMAFMDATFPF